MSVSNTRACRGVKGWMSYVTKEKESKNYNTYDRVARYHSDLGDPKATVNSIREIIKNTSREVEGFTLIQSWSAEELSRDKEEDIERAFNAGQELAHRVAPNSPAVVVTHVDGESGCVHNHIFLTNHDLETGKALRGAGRYSKHLQKVNDEVMREQGLQVVERDGHALVHEVVKARQRGEQITTTRTNKAGESEPLQPTELTKKQFKPWLRERIDEALVEPHVKGFSTLKHELHRSWGISVMEHTSTKSIKEGRDPTLTYALVDGDGDLLRTRGGKGKSTFTARDRQLGTEYSWGGLQETMEEIRELRRRAGGGGNNDGGNGGGASAAPPVESNVKKETYNEQQRSQALRAAAAGASEQSNSKRSKRRFDKLGRSDRFGSYTRVERVDRLDWGRPGEDGRSLAENRDGALRGGRENNHGDASDTTLQRVKQQSAGRSGGSSQQQARRTQEHEGKQQQRRRTERAAASEGRESHEGGGFDICF